MDGKERQPTPSTCSSALSAQFAVSKGSTVALLLSLLLLLKACSLSLASAAAVAAERPPIADDAVVVTLLLLPFLSLVVLLFARVFAGVLTVDSANEDCCGDDKFEKSGRGGRRGRLLGFAPGLPAVVVPVLVVDEGGLFLWPHWQLISQLCCRSGKSSGSGADVDEDGMLTGTKGGKGGDVGNEPPPSPSPSLFRGGDGVSGGETAKIVCRTPLTLEPPPSQPVATHAAPSSWLSEAVAESGGSSEKATVPR